MKLKDAFNLPKLSELGEFGKTEFANGVSDIRHVLIDEAWFGRSSTGGHHDHASLGWELPGDVRDERRAEDPFGERWSASDQRRQHVEPEQPHELDFDR